MAAPGWLNVRRCNVLFYGIALKECQARVIGK